MTNETAILTRSVQDGVKCPTAKEIDALILEYASAQKLSMSAQTASQVANSKTGKLKAQLVVMVEAYGVRHTEKSKLLEGIHNKAKTTTATRVSVDGAAVDGVKVYLDGLKMPDLVEKFFSTHVSYSLVDGPSEVLKTLSIATRIRTKLTGMLGLCFKVTTNAPSLSVEVVEPEKP